MKKKLPLGFILFHLSLPLAICQSDLSYFLSNSISYNPSIPTPQEILGYEIGEWQVNNDQLVKYMEAVAAVSDRVSLEVYARSYENRPLLLLTITSPENHHNLKSIQNDHFQLALGSPVNRDKINEMPIVIWMGYSVHGDESSGTNSSLLAVYHLAAAMGKEIETMLSKSIILVDPMINPDGNMRFSTWVNSRRSKNLVADPANLEHNEPWPSGRTNHYWFDLNRDWILLQHPETIGRITRFQAWKPNILTDHHEMGSNSTFFFQPGIPSRNHPHIPVDVASITEKISTFHQKALDNIGSLYFSKESYDDFYIGKGSTYPDLNGGIGILFEQASAEGHLQSTDHGILTFPFTIRNQFTTTLSSLEAAQTLKNELLIHQNQFYQSSTQLAAQDPDAAIVFGEENDPLRINAFIKILQIHGIEAYQLTSPVNRYGQIFNPGNSFVIPYNQPQYRLIKSLFEKRTEFQDSLFYDVSAWTLPLAFNIPYSALSRGDFSPKLMGEKIIDQYLTIQQPTGQPTYAYGIQWENYYAPKILYRLLKSGVRCKVATKQFSVSTTQKFNFGTIIVPLKNQDLAEDDIHELFNQIKNQNQVKVLHFNTGTPASGVFFGSNSIENIEQPKIALIVGNGINSYDAGEVWHLLDQRMDIDLTMFSIEDLQNVNLNAYNKLIMVDGNYSQIGDQETERIKNWVNSGGSIISMRRAGKWLSDKGISSNKYLTIKNTDSLVNIKYEDRQPYRGAQVIGGAIFATEIDLTHPLAFGYQRRILPMFKKGVLFMESGQNPFTSPVKYLSSPLLSGYISEKNLLRMSGTPAVNISISGKGRIITFADNLNFRAYWYGTHKMFLNSIFFSQIINI